MHMKIDKWRNVSETWVLREEGKRRTEVYMTRVRYLSEASNI
jgi:hypothetical protein